MFFVKTFVRFFMVFVLCQVAYAAYCQQMEGKNLRLLIIPGLGIHLEQLPVANLIVPYVAGDGKGHRRTQNNTGKQEVAALVVGEPISDGESVLVSDFEDIPDPLIRKYAEMINKDVHEIDNYPLYKFVDAWYGVQYRWGGEDKHGIDCSALSRKLYDSIYGYNLARTSKQQHKQCQRIKRVADAEEGDLIFFRMSRFRISHVGVYLANGYFLHASKSQGVMISNLNSKYWHRRYAGCGRVEHEEKNIYESSVLQ